jgi:glycerol-3-phosphate dehydrogenase
MKRNKIVSIVADKSILWDIIIVGGGATGLGTALDAASRGYKVLLVEQSDFGKGTSSKSTKLAHGGVRYLQQGNISLVLEALKERGIMRKNAPHLVRDLEFIVPVYDWWEGPFYGIGLKLYDLLAGKEGFGPSKFLSKEEVLDKIPNVEEEGLRGGIIYHDGQFDDARMLINLAQTAIEQGATVVNYMKVISIIKNEELIDGIILEDMESNQNYRVKTRVLINATGVFSDSIRQLDEVGIKPIMTSSQGVHIVLDNSFLPGNSAIMVPHTDDGRVLFAVPWKGKVIVGTTDTPIKEYSLDPSPLNEEIDFLLTHVARYLEKDPSKEDIKSVFVGLRPLVKEDEENNTAVISREHSITISRSGLVTITGGKWTTYRKMAEDALNKALIIADLDPKPCVTENLQLFGFHKNANIFDDFERYGSAAPELMNLLNEDTTYRNRLHADYPFVEGEVIWAIRKEMARTPEDFLARRTRLLFLDARACIATVKKVVILMASELERDDKWINEQLENFNALAKKYLPAVLK